MIQRVVVLVSLALALPIGIAWPAPPPTGDLHLIGNTHRASGTRSLGTSALQARRSTPRISHLRQSVLAPQASRKKHLTKKSKHTSPQTRASQQASWAVSVSDYNLLRFRWPVRKAILPPRAPLAGAPYYLDGNRILMLRFTPDAGRPVQVIVELSDGTTRVLHLVPTKGIPGQNLNFTRTAAGRLKQVRTVRVAPITSADPNARYVPALAALAQGGHPSGYRRTRPGLVLDYDRLIARPIVAWITRYSATQITVYKILPKNGAQLVLDPSQFYRPGVDAAMLTGSIADARRHPLLYLVTEKQD